MSAYDTWRCELNSLGHGQAFAQLFGPICRWCYKTQRWYVYDGRRWVEDDGEIMGELGHRVRDKYHEDLGRLQEMISAMPTDTIESRHSRALLKRHLEAFKKHLAGHLGTAKALCVMVASARDMKISAPDGSPLKLTVSPDAFDVQEYLLNTPTCVVDLRSSTRMPHDAALMISRITSATYAPTAKAPRFSKFIREIMCGDAARIRFLQEVIGYLFTAEASERKVVVFYGRNGSNGKTTLANILKRIAGKGYSGGLPVATLLERRHGGSEIDVGLTTLSGKRFVVAIEPSQAGRGVKFDSGVVKALSGADEDGILARRPHEVELLAARPGCKIVLLTNHLPAWEDDEAFDDRFLVVPFDQQFKGDCEHKALAQELVAAEAPGILAWIVEGARLYYEHGRLKVPAELLERAAARRADADHLGEWFEQCCSRDGRARSSVRQMRKSYCWFLGSRGVLESEWPSETRFSRMLDRFAPKRKRDRLGGAQNQVTVALGVRLKVGEGGEVL